MDPEKAKRLFESGSCLLCLDVPVGTEFGIDYMTWSVGDKFKGVKLIPPGIHFVHTSPKGYPAWSWPPLSVVGATLVLRYQAVGSALGSLLIWRLPRYGEQVLKQAAPNFTVSEMSLLFLTG